MDLEGFKELQADLGSYFMTEPMFNIILALREKLKTNKVNEMQIGND
jgi:hypothetical protein